MSLLEKALKKIEESKNIGNNIKEEEFISKSNFVGTENIHHTSSTDISEDLKLFRTFLHISYSF